MAFREVGGTARRPFPTRRMEFGRDVEGAVPYGGSIDFVGACIARPAGDQWSPLRDVTVVRGKSVGRKCIFCNLWGVFCIEAG